MALMLVALGACSVREERGERLEEVQSSISLGAAEPRLVRNVVGGGSVAHVRSDTLAWTDSTTRGDTTFLSSSRAISTTAVISDSQWVRIAVPVMAGGIPFGLTGVWSGTELALGTELFTMTYNGETPATLLA